MFFSRENKDRQLICDIQKAETEEWIHGLILNSSINHNIIEIFVFAEYIKSYFNENEKVKIKLINDGSELIFNGVILKKILSIFNQEIIVKIDEQKNFPNYRKNERYHFACDVTITDKEGIVSTGTLEDISLEGLLLLSEDTLSENDHISICIPAFPEKILHLKCQVLRKSEYKRSCRYAIKFNPLADTNAVILKELIIFLDMQKMRIKNQWRTLEKLKYGVSMQQNRLRL